MQPARLWTANTICELLNRRLTNQEIHIKQQRKNEAKLYRLFRYDNQNEHKSQEHIPEQLNKRLTAKF